MWRDPCAVERSTERLWSPLDFVSGYGAISAPFRVGPTRGFPRRVLDRTPSVGTKRRKRRQRRRAIPCDGTRRVSGGRAYIELVARSPHTNVSFERSIPRSLPLASGVPQGGTPWVDSFPYFLANQEIGNARPRLARRVPAHGMGRRRLPGKTSTNSNLSLYTPSERSPLHGKGSNRSAGRVAGNRADL